MKVLACPNCGDTDGLQTTERVLGCQSASVTVRDDGSTDIEWGSTDMLWDTSETLAWSCAFCLWEGPEGVTDPVAVLVPAASAAGAAQGKGE